MKKEVLINSINVIKSVPFYPEATFVGGYSGHGMGIAFGDVHDAILRCLHRPFDFELIF